MAGHVFLSHSTRDDDFVGALSQGLEAYGTTVWNDSRELAPGDLLAPNVREALEDADSLLAVISAHAFNSKWIPVEIDGALRLGRRVIPLLLPPMTAESLGHFFGKDLDAAPLALDFDPEKERIDDLMPRLRTALGHLAPDRVEPVAQPEAPPMAELIVRLDDPSVDGEDRERRAQATAQLRYRPPAGSNAPEVESRRFTVRAPIGPIEAGELAWYLEEFGKWPSEHFLPRAEAVEADLGRWGRALLDALQHEEARSAWEAFRHAPDDAERVISIFVDPDVGRDAPEDEARVVREAATTLLGLPWELLRDGQGFLASGKHAVRVRRRLPNRDPLEPLVTTTPVRVLVVSPRPEDDQATYLDHRLSARPLVDAFAGLGGRVELEILREPTLAGLSEALAASKDRPFHVVHFDGHGVYHREHGLGALCFEDAADGHKLEKRKTELIFADELAEVLRAHRVPLVFLEACQSAQADKDPSASVAGRLLRGGVASVIAMSHSVLVATAERFVEIFYQRLSRGATVGAAVRDAQRRLRDDPSRGRSFFGELKLADWFVPVLYQEELDPQLVREVPGQAARDDIALRAEKAVEGLPASPDHGFVGRSRELLKVERLLAREPYAVLVGEGGQGKTTLAVELARWLVRSRRFEAAAFVSVEDGQSRDARSALAAIGLQLVPGFGTETDFERMWQIVERRLKDRPTLVVFDNLESLLPEAEGLYEPEILEGVLALAARCSQVGATRVVLTSRTELPAPLARHVVRIGRLEPSESVELVGRILGVDGPGDGVDESVEDVERLVETAQHHARSLVLLAQEVRRAGVRATTEGLQEIMATLAERYPDDRERSLFASVGLSLHRLPVETREKLRRIGVFHGGGHGFVIAQVLGLDYDNDEEIALAQQLIEVGVAEMLPYGYLRLHPALAPMMLRELDEPEREEAHAAWVEAMIQLVGFLTQQRDKDTRLAAALTLWDLPNLLGALDALGRSLERGTVGAERVVDVATSMERLLQNLGRPKALARVVEIREKASARLGDWGHARFISESAAIDRLLEAGRLGEALARAEEALGKARAACPSEGAEAYPGASYDLAMASFRLGRVLRMGGRADAALGPLGEARQRFSRLAESGDVDAERMASVYLTETGDCLRDLGRLDEAAEAYESAIELAEGQDSKRNAAVGKGNLGTVRLLQRRFKDALQAYGEARETFEQMGESGSVATIWHQIGMVHQEARQYEAAERAYRQSLGIEVGRGDRAGEASSLGQLGNLYSLMGKLEDSVRFYREAATIADEIGDLKGEGTRRSNVADKLIQLERYDEARQEIERAIKCKEGLGHAAEPWKTFMIRHNLERAVGDADAAAEARERAVEAYLAYRRDGGGNHEMAAQLAAGVGQAIVGGEVEAMASMLDQLAGQFQGSGDQRFIAALRAILGGSRDPALASDPELYFEVAVELRLLLEALSGLDATE